MALDTIPKQEGGKLKAVASGTLPSGVPVVVNSDGTVSVIEGVTGGTGTPVVFAAYNSTHQAAVFDSSNNKVVVAYSQDASPQYGYAVVGTVSGTSISFGTPVVFHSGETTLTFAVFDSNSNKVVITYRDGGASNYGKAVVGTVSGTSISFGSEATFSSGGVGYPAATFDSNSNKVVITYSGNSNYGTAIVGTVSGTSISFGSETVFESQRVDYVFPTFDSANNKVVVAYRVFSGAREGYARVGTVSGTSISFGSSVQFEAGQTNHIKSTFDSSNDKVVLFYRDDNNSDQGTAIVGTVSGTSISFGTPVIFSTTSVDQLSAVFNTSSNKIFIGYTDYGNSSYGTLISGTVSGTSISFEDKIIFEDSSTFYTNLAFDSTSNAIVAAYRNTANSSYGTAAVYKPSSTNLTSENYIGMSGGTVSGAPQSVGSASVYESATSSSNSPAFDSTNNKVVVAYRDGGNSNYGTAVVGTVSGTSISFGTPVVFASSNAIPSTTYDANAQKIVIAYSDQTDTEKGKAIVGTVSGTSISFGTAVQFESGITDNLVAVYDPVATKPVFVYRDKGNSEYGTAIVGTVSGTSISFGSASLFVSAVVSGVSACYDSTSGKIVVAYRNSSTTNGNGAVGTVSGTSISFGSSTEFGSGNVGDTGIAPDTTSGKLIVSYKDGANSDYGTAVVATVSGTSISFGTPVVFESASVGATVLVANSDLGNAGLSYQAAEFYFREAEVSGSTVVFGSKETISASASFYGAAYDSNSSVFVSTYRDGSNSNYGTARVFTPNTITRGSVADGDNATIDIVGTVSSNQLSLTAGQQYYVQTDGTIGTTPADPSVLAGTAVSATKMVVKS